VKTLLPHGIENRCAAVESHLMTSLAQSVGHRQEGIQVGSQRPYGQEKSGQANANNTRSLRRQPVQYQTQDRLVPMDGQRGLALPQYHWYRACYDRSGKPKAR
jgi:hypothetical protein